MKRARSALTKGQVEAVKSARSATVLVRDLNRQISQQGMEIEGLRENYADLQDRYEKVRTENHELDVDNSIFRALQDIFWLTEILKFLSTSVLAGYGINLASNGNNAGWLFVIGAAVVYGLIAGLQSKAYKARKNTGGHS